MRFNPVPGLLILLVSLQACFSKNPEPPPSDFYTQGSSNRLAAEWEPAKGAMITWPLCIPHSLVIELAKDTHLYTLVADSAAAADARRWYKTWGIDSSHNSFITTPQGVDAWWVRDWGPGAVFTPQLQMKLGDGHYIYSTPVTDLSCNGKLEFLYTGPNNQVQRTDTEDRATGFLAKGLGLERLDLPFINTGGNVLTDGLGTAFSTCVLLHENRFNETSSSEFLRLNRELLGISRYHIIPNFEQRGIQHIDCFMKLLDPERILVLEPPQDHPAHAVFEEIIRHDLSQLQTPFGRHYQILRIQSGRFDSDGEFAAYTNSFILNKTVYVPLFGIPEDSAALQTWQKAMPGYAIKGFDYLLKNEPAVSPAILEHYEDYGWKEGDALHCRVRAVWDDQMLFISVKPLDPLLPPTDQNIVHCSIIDYSGLGVLSGDARLYWRIQGTEGWQSVPLNWVAGNSHFFAAIPCHEPGRILQYYVSAKSVSGRTETYPRSAPAGVLETVITAPGSQANDGPARH